MIPFRGIIKETRNKCSENEDLICDTLFCDASEQSTYNWKAVGYVDLCSQERELEIYI